MIYSKQSTKKVLLVIAMLLSACGEEFLTTEPKGTVTSEQVWSSAQNANQMLNSIYGQLPWDFLFGMDPIENWTDNSMATFSWPTSRVGIALRNYGASNSPMQESWNTGYANIRACNVLLKEVAESGIPDADKQKLLAQGRFLRGFFYFELYKAFGGVPLIDVPLDRSTGGDIFYSRATGDATIDFIRKDMTAAAEALPVVWGAADSGRPTKGAALALRSEAELYSAHWAECVATCDEIFALGVYSLVNDYASLFQPATEKNTEVIFDIEFDGATRGHSAEVFQSPRVDPASGVAAGWGHALPTQQLVDAYEFTDGTPGTSPAHASEPYKGRDKRFYATIIHDGMPWRGDTVWTRYNPNVKQGSFDNSFDVNFTHQGTLTGYYFKKLLDPTLTPSETNFYSRPINKTNAVLFRLGEIYLNYAEAKNELSGPDAQIYKYLNDLRKRGGLPDLPAGLAKDQMKTKIQNERRVELAYEGKRYWDILRWRIGHVIAEPKKGMKIDKLANGTLTYTRVDAFGGNTNFRESMDYLFPIPQTAIDQNHKLQGAQNPGF